MRHSYDGSAYSTRSALNGLPQLNAPGPKPPEPAEHPALPALERPRHRSTLIGSSSTGLGLTRMLPNTGAFAAARATLVFPTSPLPRQPSRSKYEADSNNTGRLNVFHVEHCAKLRLIRTSPADRTYLLVRIFIQVSRELLVRIKVDDKLSALADGSLSTLVPSGLKHIFDVASTSSALDHRLLTPRSGRFAPAADEILGLPHRKSASNHLAKSGDNRVRFLEREKRTGVAFGRSPRATASCASFSAGSRRRSVFATEDRARPTRRAISSCVRSNCSMRA